MGCGAGHQPGRGDSRPTVRGWSFVWHDLDEPLVETFSRSRGKARRSMLERYDHEHAFRVKVAENACRITGCDDDPQPLVEPIGQDECGRCPYEQWCAQQMGAGRPVGRDHHRSARYPRVADAAAHGRHHDGSVVGGGSRRSGVFQRVHR